MIKFISNLFKRKRVSRPPMTDEELLEKGWVVVHRGNCTPEQERTMKFCEIFSHQRVDSMMLRIEDLEETNNE